MKKEIIVLLDLGEYKQQIKHLLFSIDNFWFNIKTNVPKRLETLLVNT
jgi:hypothetical protein